MLDDTSKLNEIINLSSELNNVQDLDILFDRILTEARRLLNADAASIQIRDGDDLVFSHVQTESLQRKLLPGQKLIYTTFRSKINNQSMSGYVALTGEILNIPDVYNIPASSPYKFNSDNDKRSNYLTKSMLTIPLKNNRNDVLGVMQIINSLNPDPEGECFGENDYTGGIFSRDDEMIALHFANVASMILQRAQGTRALILRMISMAELRDPKETGAHVNRVGAYSVEIYEGWAIKNNVPRHEIDQNRDILRMAAMLHDVGKVAISDLILKKPASFNDEEYRIMKTHSFQGARLFKHVQSEFDEVSLIVALRHHERWDGTGYPGHIDIETGEPTKTDDKGNPLPLKGEEIPIYGRIVAVADVYDALRSRRVYKEAWDEDAVLQEIKDQSGKQFDPEIVDVFLMCLDVIHSISERYPDEE